MPKVAEKKTPQSKSPSKFTKETYAFFADAHRAAARNRAEPTDVVPERFSLEAGPEQMALDSESSARMAKLLAVLPEKQREILILRVVVGMSAEETAEAVGSTAGAVRVAQHRALARLKAEIIATGHDYA